MNRTWRTFIFTTLILGVFAYHVLTSIKGVPETTYPYEWLESFFFYGWLLLTATSKFMTIVGVRNPIPKMLALLFWAVTLFYVMSVTMGMEPSGYHYTLLENISGFFLILGMPVVDFLDFCVLSYQEESRRLNPWKSEFRDM